MRKCGYCGKMATKQVKQFGRITYVCKECYNRIVKPW